MKFDVNLVFCALVVLTDSSQTRGQSSPLAPVLTPATLPSHARTSASRALTEDAGTPHGGPDPAGWDGISAKIITVTNPEETVQSETVTHPTYGNHLMATSATATTSQSVTVQIVTTVQPGEPPASSSATPHSLSSLPGLLSTTPLWHISTTEGNDVLTRDPITISTPHSAQTSQSITLSQPESSTMGPTQSTTTSCPQTSAPGRIPFRPTNQQVPSELNVGDEELKMHRHHRSSFLDPLLAGLMSVFIVSTAIVFVLVFILFLRFRQRTNNPEFHRLRDLPMDDLMEDMSLSRSSY